MKSKASVTFPKSKSARRSRSVRSLWRHVIALRQRVFVVIRTWCSRVFYVGKVMRSVLCKCWDASRQLSIWLTFHFIAPAVCFACVYFGVLSTVFLPATFWDRILPGSFIFMQSTPISVFPIVRMPEPKAIPSVLLVAFPLSLAVFKRHYSEWKASNDPWLARMLFAACAGTGWTGVWFRRRTNR